MRLLHVLALAIAFAVCLPAAAHDKLREKDALKLGAEVYVFGYPMVLMDVTRQVSTAVPKVLGQKAPVNQFAHLREFPDYTFTDVVSPNADTLYSSAWLDLKAEPVVLSVPATDRYFMLPMLSMWSNVFAVPGTCTTGPNSAWTFLVVGPGWRGNVPSGMEVIQSPTRYVWFIGCTQTNGKADYDNVRRIQDGYKLTLLSGWGKADYVPPKGMVDPTIDMRTPPPAQIDKMDAATFFARFVVILKNTPPNQVDDPTVHRLQRVGIEVGKSFDLKAAPAVASHAFGRATADAKSRLAAENKKVAGESGKGWAYRTTGSAYGVDYLYRAVIAYSCLGYNLPQDAIYPSLAMDSEGRPFDGNNAYVLHFDKGKLPPVSAFWSVTAYDSGGYFIPNALERQAIGDRDKLALNADGSLDLYLQAESLGQDKEGNWLPVAKAPFNLLTRLYWPRDEILRGSWTPPAVGKIQ